MEAPKNETNIKSKYRSVFLEMSKFAQGLIERILCCCSSDMGQYVGSQLPGMSHHQVEVHIVVDGC